MPKNLLCYLLLLTLVISINACDRVKKKGHNAVTKAKNFRDRQVDKIFPTYDSFEKDTKNNKQRFKEHMQVALTNDVKDIYAYGDFMGIDYKVLLAFTCDDSTIKQIVETKGMTISTEKNDDGFQFVAEFDWWHKKQLEVIKPYKVAKELAYWEYLWYNPETKQAFYEEFSL